MKSHQKTLDKVHSASNTAELIAAYDEWAEHYDHDLQQGFDYQTPQIASRMLLDSLGNTDLLILDAGCGTGLVGEMLAKAGCSNIHGLDYSEKMLEKAREKNIYSKLFQADMTRPLDIPDNAYDAVICIGTFTHHHVGPQALPELLRITRPKGLLCFSVRSSAWSEDGYRKRLLDLEAEDKWELMQLITADYLKTDGIDCRICLYRATS